MTIEILEPRDVPLGGPRAMDVRRTLPQRSRSLVGAWCFVDHFGPDRVRPDSGMHVPPHPHTGLQTVTWLFEGEVEHRDSTGAHEIVRPGAVNLMTAGSGVQHSEYSTATTTLLQGVQLWVALPDAARDAPARFEHHRAPSVEIGDATLLVFVGGLAGTAIATTTHSPLVAAQIDLPPGGAVEIPVDPAFEHGFLVDDGEVRVDGDAVPRGALAFVPTGREVVRVEAGDERARLVLIGGAPFAEPIVMWWNFIGRTHEEIAAFRAAWQDAHPRFGRITDPAPPLPAPELPRARLVPRAAPERDSGSAARAQRS